MGLILPSIQTRQPQQGPKLNWANPITRGADVAFVRLDQPMLFGPAKLSKTGSPSLVTAAYGIGMYFANSSSDGFNTSSWPILADGTEYTYLVVAQLTATGTTDYLVNGDNAFRAFQFRIETTGAPTLIGFNTAVSTFSATGSIMPIGEAQAIGARYTATEVAIFQKGIKTASTAASGTIKGQTASDIQIAQRLGNNLHGSIGLVIRWPRGLSDAELKSATANPWQLLQASQRQMPVDAPVAGSPTGTFAATMGDATLAANGAVVDVSTFAATMSNATMAASGAVTDAGTFSSLLDSAIMSATGGIVSTGPFASTLAGASMAASGSSGSFVPYTKPIITRRHLRSRSRSNFGA